LPTKILGRVVPEGSAEDIDDLSVSTKMVIVCFRKQVIFMFRILEIEMTLQNLIKEMLEYLINQNLVIGTVPKTVSNIVE